MSGTPAIRVLEKAKISFTLLHYNYEKGGQAIGLYAADAIGEPPSRVLKTLMVEAGGKPACTVIPCNAELSMKLVASAFREKNAQMMKPEAAERLTGYHVGGISPFGQRKKVPILFEKKPLGEPYVIINGGQRGLLLKLDMQDALIVLQAKTADLTSPDINR